MIDPEPYQDPEEIRKKQDYCAVYDGGECVAILRPVPSCHLTLEQIVKKDLPKGTRYKIIPVSEIPTDRTFRNAWDFVDDEETLVNE